MTQKRTSDNDLVVSGNTAAARRKAARSRTKHSTAAAETPVVSASAAVPETAEPVPTVSETTSPVLSPVTIVELEPQAVARLAYSYWEARGCQGGSAEEDWLRAEMEIRNVSGVIA